jgi:hypothetical protein
VCMHACVWRERASERAKERERRESLEREHAKLDPNPMNPQTLTGHGQRPSSSLEAAGAQDLAACLPFARYAGGAHRRCSCFGVPLVRVWIAVICDAAPCLAPGWRTCTSKFSLRPVGEHARQNFLDESAT